MKSAVAIGFATVVLCMGAMTVPAAAVPTPVTSVDPGLDPLSVDGDLKLVFAFSNAGNEDLIMVLPALKPNPLIDNHTTPVGSIVDLGSYTGDITFSLHNLKTGATYTSDTLDASGDYHVKLDPNYGDFNVGPLPLIVQTELGDLADQGFAITFMAWEDHDAHSYIKSDWDYNDVVYAFAYRQTTQSLVPEPLTISIVGLGLLGAFSLRRRKQASTGTVA